eukprot:31318-Pelagococcus_subviridis.AAC.12
MNNAVARRRSRGARRGGIPRVPRVQRAQVIRERRVALHRVLRESHPSRDVPPQLLGRDRVVPALFGDDGDERGDVHGDAAERRRSAASPWFSSRRVVAGYGYGSVRTPIRVPIRLRLRGPVAAVAPPRRVVVVVVVHPRLLLDRVEAAPQPGREPARALEQRGRRSRSRAARFVFARRFRLRDY